MDGKTWHFSDTFPVHDGVSGSLISNEISSQIVSFMMFLSSASAASEAFLITYYRMMLLWKRLRLFRPTFTTRPSTAAVFQTMVIPQR